MSKIPGKKLIPTELSMEREQIAWDLRQKCWTHERIAKHLGVTQPSVTRMLNRLTEKYAKELMDKIKVVKADQVRQLEAIADEAMQQWELSKKPYNMTSVKRIIDHDGNLSEAGEHTESNVEKKGDPKHLLVLLKAKEDIRKIMGANAPIKIANFNRDVKEMSDEELEKYSTGKAEDLTQPDDVFAQSEIIE